MDAATAILDAFDRRPDPSRAPFVLGIAGAQGSGKSTIATGLVDRLRARGLVCAQLSLDDLYFDRKRRAALAEAVHPLFRTRGVPGTHDVALGLAVIRSLGAPTRTMVPRFDKARDAPVPEDQWEPVDGPLDVLIFEGWCLGALPQEQAALDAPVNRLEREQDPERIWRRYVNDQLASAYRALFDRIDLLALLAAPNFDIVATWRFEQEAALRAALDAQGAAGEALMSKDEIGRFVQHYQRLTEHILAGGMRPAGLVIRLDAERRVIGIDR